MGLVKSTRVPLLYGSSTEWSLWRTYAKDPTIVILRRTNGELTTAHIYETLKFKGDNVTMKVTDLPVQA